MTDQDDYERRFGGVSRLYGASGLANFKSAHVCVVGIGGVGSWAVEALARNAIGKLTLIDLDNIAESNVNRQLHAVNGAFGKAKVSAMAERIAAINPLCQVVEIEEFVSADNVGIMLGGNSNGTMDVVLDAIDDARAKAAMAAFCKQQGIPLVMTGAAGGRLDPTRMRSTDLAQTNGDRLLAKVRNLLRRDYQFPKGEKTRFGIQAVFSDEQAQAPEASCETDTGDNSSITGLNCAGYGSSVCVTAPFGMAAAGIILNILAART